MMAGTLMRYFAFRFLVLVVGTFGSLFFLIMMLDFLELMRRTSDVKGASALFVAQVALYRTPHLTERIIPFAILISTMVCYLNLSRRLELVVVRAAGISAWQFVMPALVLSLIIGIAATTIYNPISANFRERSEQLERRLFGRDASLVTSENLWLRQRTQDGQSIINAASSRQQGAELSDLTVFMLDDSDGYVGRIEARSATLREGFWRLENARVYAGESAPVTHKTYDLKTNLTRAQVQETFATPDAVPFWQLSSLIRLAEDSGLAAVAYRLQYYQLLVLPLYLVAMVLLAAAVSLRTVRFGGVQKMVLGGLAAGLSLFVLSKIATDLSKAHMLTPVMAATLPAFVGGFIGTMALLYQEDG